MEQENGNKTGHTATEPGRGMQVGSQANATSFKPGCAAGPGRPRGARNKVDLPQLILNGAARAGFLKIGEDGKRVYTGVDGTEGYLLWCAVNEPRTYMALLARILPFYIVNELPDKSIISRDEAMAQLRERGLPLELIDHLRRAPEVLDDDEDPDPYRLKDVTPDISPDDAGK
jgi:hypothetical protein